MDEKTNPQATTEQTSVKSRREAYERRRQQIEAAIERKVERAKQIDTRVINIRSEDVNILINLLSQSDIAIDRIRKRMGTKVDVADALEIIRRFEDMTLLIEGITIDALKLTNSAYIQPREIKAIIDRRKEAKN